MEDLGAAAHLHPTFIQPTYCTSLYGTSMSIDSKTCPCTSEFPTKRVYYTTNCTSISTILRASRDGVNYLSSSPPLEVSPPSWGYPGIPKYPPPHPGIIIGWGELGTPFVQVSRDSQVSSSSWDHPRMGWTRHPPLSKYPGIPKYFLHPGIILGWGALGTPFPPCPSIPGFPSISSIPGSS